MSHQELQNNLIQKILRINETTTLQKFQKYMDAQDEVYTLSEFEAEYIEASQKMFEKEGGKSNEAVFKDIEAWLEQ